MNQINPSNLNLLIGNTDWYTEPLPLDTRYLITEFNLIHIDKEPRELENYILPIPLLYMDELRGPIVSKYSIEIEGSSRGSSQFPKGKEGITYYLYYIQGFSGDTSYNALCYLDSDNLPYEVRGYGFDGILQTLNVAEWSQGEHPQYDWNDLHQVMYLLVT